jgi:hypothetical protein
MKLIAIEIPDEATALPGWLEQHLVGADLGTLVAELEAVHGPVAKVLPLDQVLGRHREDVLARGLGVLSANRLRRFLRQPRLLLELQELILTSGGPFWLHRAASATEHRPAVERGWHRLAATLAPEPTRTGAGATPSAPTRADRSPWSRLRWIVSLATAAVLLGVVLVPLWRGQHPGAGVAATAGWGWSRPGALPQDLPRGDYLNRLADGAEEWFHQRPDEPLALARRIAEFRQGCSVLILSPHRPLPAVDRAWLVEKCRGWAAQFDGYLAAVEAGQDPREVRSQADETVHRLIAVLHERAAGSA